MSKADYALCVLCGGKSFYDAEVDYTNPSFGSMVTLCATCDKTHRILPMLRPTCKHCGMALESRVSDSWVHTEGPQARMITCAVKPYGFHAEPVGTECCDFPGNLCNGARGIHVEAEG